MLGSESFHNCEEKIHISHGQRFQRRALGFLFFPISGTSVPCDVPRMHGWIHPKKFHYSNQNNHQQLLETSCLLTNSTPSINPRETVSKSPWTIMFSSSSVRTVVFLFSEPSCFSLLSFATLSLRKNSLSATTVDFGNPVMFCNSQTLYLSVSRRLREVHCFNECCICFFSSRLMLSVSRRIAGGIYEMLFCLKELKSAGFCLETIYVVAIIFGTEVFLSGVFGGKGRSK